MESGFEVQTYVVWKGSAVSEIVVKADQYYSLRE